MCMNSGNIYYHFHCLFSKPVLDKTHFQKGLKVPYFINLLQQNAYIQFNGIYVNFGITP